MVSIVSYSRLSLMIIAPATLELTPGPTGLTYISHKAARRQPKVGTDQATNAQLATMSSQARWRYQARSHLKQSFWSPATLELTPGPTGLT